MVTMISNAAQTFIPLVVMWPLQIIQETWATRNTATQIILNRQLKGAEFEVAARYGVLLSTVYVPPLLFCNIFARLPPSLFCNILRSYACMLYSAAMPFLNIVRAYTPSPTVLL